MDPVLKAFEDHAEKSKKRCERSSCRKEVKSETEFYCPECKKNPIWPV